MGHNGRASPPASGSSVTAIPFIDLATQRRRIAERVESGIRRVLEHGAYVMGPEVATLEQQLAQWAGTRHAISCASGTDALVMALMARGIGPGDAVFVPSFTFVATAEAAVLVGASPVFVDILPDLMTMDPESLGRAIARARAAGLEPRAVIPVDLFGQPADYRTIAPMAAAEGLVLIADAAQSFGGSLDGRPIGALADITTTSFFPAKPLGCYGDGGALFTDDDETAAVLKSIRAHGQGRDRYEHVRVGITGRLDTIQAAVLIEKLTIFADEIEARDRIAQRYNTLLADVAETPSVIAGGRSVWAQYTLAAPDRDRVVESLKADGVPTGIYYPAPLHLQGPYAGYPRDPAGLPVTEARMARVFSLPMHPYLDEPTQDRIVAAVRRAAGGA